MEFYVWNDENKWITKEINYKNLNYINFKITNKLNYFINGELSPKIHLIDGKVYTALVEEINDNEIEYFAKRFFVAIQSNVNFDNEQEMQKILPDSVTENNILKVGHFVYINLDNLKSFEPYNYEKGLIKSGIRFTFINDKTITVRLTKKNCEKVKLIINKYINDNKENEVYEFMHL